MFLFLFPRARVCWSIDGLAECSRIAIEINTDSVIVFDSLEEFNGRTNELITETRNGPRLSVVAIKLN